MIFLVSPAIIHQWIMKKKGPNCHKSSPCIPNSPNDLDNSKISHVKHNTKLNREQYLRDFPVLIFQTNVVFFLLFFSLLPMMTMCSTELYGALKLETGRWETNGRNWRQKKLKEEKNRKRNWKQATKTIFNHFKIKRIKICIQTPNIIHYYPVYNANKWNGMEIALCVLNCCFFVMVFFFPALFQAKLRRRIQRKTERKTENLVRFTRFQPRKDRCSGCLTLPSKLVWC